MLQVLLHGPRADVDPGGDSAFVQPRRRGRGSPPDGRSGPWRRGRRGRGRRRGPALLEEHHVVRPGLRRGQEPRDQRPGAAVHHEGAPGTARPAARLLGEPAPDRVGERARPAAGARYAPRGPPVRARRGDGVPRPSATAAWRGREDQLEHPGVASGPPRARRRRGAGCARCGRSRASIRRSRSLKSRRSRFSAIPTTVPGLGTAA